MKLPILTLVLAALGAEAARAELVAIRVGYAETASAGRIDDAVILVEGDKIVAVGAGLFLDRGIPLLERPDWVALPGLVNAYSRRGLEGSAGDEFTPQQDPKAEVLARNPAWRELLEAGVTTVALYPPGSGVAGQAIVVRPHGDDAAAMLVKESAYLKMVFRSDVKSRKTLRDAFAKVEDYDEKLAKEREKWQKEVEKAEKAKKSSSSKKKEEEKKEEEKKEEKEEDGEKDDEKSAAQEEQAKPKEGEVPAFVPPELDPEIEVFQRVRDKQLGVLFAIDKAGDYLHLVAAIDEREFDWNLRVRSTQNLDIFHVKDEIGERKAFVLIEPLITLFPGTMRQRNLPHELAQAGARLVLLPRQDSEQGHERWLADVGVLIKSGLPRETAIAALTKHPAEFLGLGAELGSLEAGKLANILFLNGDPFEPATEVEAVMLEGKFVFEETSL